MHTWIISNSWCMSNMEMMYLFLNHQDIKYTHSCNGWSSSVYYLPETIPATGDTSRSSRVEATGFWTQIYEGKAEMQGNKQISRVVIERRNETKARSGEGAWWGVREEPSAIMTSAQKTEVPGSGKSNWVSVWGPVGMLKGPGHQKGWGGTHDGRRDWASGQGCQTTQGLADHGKTSGLHPMGHGKPLAGGEKEGEISWLLEKNSF